MIAKFHYDCYYPYYYQFFTLLDNSQNDILGKTTKPSSHWFKKLHYQVNGAEILFYFYNNINWIIYVFNYENIRIAFSPKLI